MIGPRIRQARIAAGLTQDEVVDALAQHGVSLTKAGLSKYERGGSTPQPTVLRALAQALAVETSFFTGERAAEVEWLSFRKAARMAKARQERVKALAESQLEMVITLRAALEPGQKPKPPARTRVVHADDAEIAAQAVRKHWRLGDQPIESVTTAIEDGGGIVIETGSDDDLFDGLSGWVNKSIPVIVVSAAVSDDRRRFSLSHELGHLFMDVRNAEPSSEEKLAHRFAAAFLVTAATARRELGTRRRNLDFRELAMLKQKHGLSMQAWILRATDLGIITESHARSLFAELGARGWRKREPVDFDGNERPAKLRQLTVRALAEGLLSRSRAERIWPGVTRGLDDPAPEQEGPLDARSVMRLPQKERERLLEQAAVIAASEYENQGGLAGLESLAEEDHRDVPVEE